MKSSAWKWWMRLAALLTLAFVLAWPSLHQGSASPYNALPQAETPEHHPHGQQADHHRHSNGNVNVDCDSMSPGFCMMAHCSAGILVDQPGLPEFVSFGGMIVALAVCGTGIHPEMVLPPPRWLSV